MTPVHRPDMVRQATTEGITRIYLVVLGLAISESLLRTFTAQPGDGASLGMGVFDARRVHQLGLLVAFLCTTTRFAHGSVIHLRALSTARKWHWDMLAFLSQSVLFFLTAISIGTVGVFLFLFLLVLVADTAWLFILEGTDHKRTKTEVQWLTSNILLITLLVALLLLAPPNWIAAASIGVAAAAAAVWDYHSNHAWYFPDTTGTDPSESAA